MRKTKNIAVTMSRSSFGGRPRHQTVLNIGLERGIITPTLFSILVFMAIVTTLMATPMFNRFYRQADGSVFKNAA